MTVLEIYLTTNIRNHFKVRHTTNRKILNKIYIEDFIKALRKIREGRKS